MENKFESLADALDDHIVFVEECIQTSLNDLTNEQLSQIMKEWTQ